MTNIIVEIESLDKWQRVALASMCASGLSPVVVRLGQPATRRAFEQGLEAAWNSARDGAADPRVASARSTLDDLAESACDDSNVPAYEVMRAIGALACTLDAVMDESEQPAIESCNIVIGSCGGFDHVLVYGNQTRSIDPRNPPPPGRLEAILIQLQLRSIEAMRNAGHDGGQVVSEMQGFGNQLAAELDLALPGYAERRGWKL
jgi:hypothetical protein